ncbi:uridine kinase [Dysgonomonas macrotermitis]|uniref:uridine/cytidine kinase n=1 Tax=Dysgonomonas macrotermitis TaxID=1346286 RepID=A0A1M4YUH5_9BACT|nr:uridine kinase [Dysgonomonas macrotermitis]SHF08996.1 uridine kinase [Dysgonomonas macrotermitis]
MYVIGIAGGSGSGKTTLVESILSGIPREEISILPQDAYYRDNSHIPLEERFTLNYDHPDSIEWELMHKDIQMLKAGETIACPTYSYLTCTRLPETIPVVPKKILLVEGILIYTSLMLCSELDMKIFLEVPADQRLTRIIQRDMASRGRTALEVIDRYYKTVRPMHEEFIEPSRQQADMLVMGGGLNNKAAEFIAAAILEKLK